MTRVAQNIPAPKKFYEKASTEKIEGDVFAVMLDGRIAKTPKRHPLATRSHELSLAIAKEWEQVDEVIDTTQMPLTKLLATVIDLQTEARGEWIQEVLNFLKSDLVCYRAIEPTELVNRQLDIWTPYIEDWQSRFGAALKTTAGIVAVSQSEEAINACLLYTSDAADE